MMADSARDFPSKDLKIYQQLDQRTARLQLTFGLRCPPPLCGSCWDDCKVEATVLETFPLAGRWFTGGKRKKRCSLSSKRRQIKAISNVHSIGRTPVFGKVAGAPIMNSVL